MNKNELLDVELYDGTFTGPIAVSQHAGNIDIYKTDYGKVDVFKNEQSYNHAGIYFLIGEQDGRPALYVGQAGVRQNKQALPYRVKEHERKELNWHTVIMMTTASNNFDSAALDYLEQHFYDVLIDGSPYMITNGNRPSGGNLRRGKELYNKMVKDTIEIVKFLGYDFISEKREKRIQPSSPIREVDDFSVPVKFNRSIRGRLEYNPEGKGLLLKGGKLLLLQGSLLNADRSKGMPLPKDMKVKELNPFQLRLEEDYLVNSVSTAGNYVGGNSNNGWDCWKIESTEAPIQTIRNLCFSK